MSPKVDTRGHQRSMTSSASGPATPFVFSLCGASLVVEPLRLDVDRAVLKRRSARSLQATTASGDLRKNLLAMASIAASSVGDALANRDA
jgi:hypothetical protein